jgi:hypothetical protein
LGTTNEMKAKIVKRIWLFVKQGNAAVNFFHVLI